MAIFYMSPNKKIPVEYVNYNGKNRMRRGVRVSIPTKLQSMGLSLSMYNNIMHRAEKSSTCAMHRYFVAHIHILVDLVSLGMS